MPHSHLMHPDATPLPDDFNVLIFQHLVTFANDSDRCRGAAARLINAYSHPYSCQVGIWDMYTTHAVVADASRLPAFSRGGSNLAPKTNIRASLQRSTCTVVPP
jgi:hypothetical protein